MREKIARAICDVAEKDLFFNTLDAADAVLDAMREPTEAMMKAAEREWDGRLSFRCTGAWQAMIDAARLTPTPPR